MSFKDEKGFTFIEMIIVIVILGILASMWCGKAYSAELGELFELHRTPINKTIMIGLGKGRPEIHHRGDVIAYCMKTRSNSWSMLYVNTEGGIAYTGISGTKICKKFDKKEK